MADFYLVSVETYEQGQEWAAQNLKSLNRSKGNQIPPESDDLTSVSSNKQNRRPFNNVILVVAGLLIGFFIAEFVRE